MRFTYFIVKMKEINAYYEDTYFSFSTDTVLFPDEGFDVTIEINSLEMDGGWCFS